MNHTCFTFPSSAPGQAAWAPDPSCRGTFGIALLCLSTTIICIWSSIHRDIPLERLPIKYSLLRDAPLVLVALFAPELMFYFALNQYLCARNLVKVAERNLKVEPESNDEQVGSTGQFARIVKAFFTALHALLRNKKSNDVEMEDISSQGFLAPQENANTHTSSTTTAKATQAANSRSHAIRLRASSQPTPVHAAAPILAQLPISPTASNVMTSTNTSTSASSSSPSSSAPAATSIALPIEQKTSHWRLQTYPRSALERALHAELGTNVNQNLLSKEHTSATLITEETRSSLDIRSIQSDATSRPDPQRPRPSQSTAEHSCTTKPRKNHFTLKHGFYAVMGGFAFEHNHVAVKLTAEGVKDIMESQPDLIPDLASTYISDREKSTGLGKAMLIVQVFWFCINCVSRLAEHLPLSLLEVSTLAHGLFTLLSYAVWWSKPLNIDAPFLIAVPIRVPEEAGITSSSVPGFKDLFKNVGLKTLGQHWAIDFSVTTIIPLVYGVLHFLALLGQFPTTIERELWCIASIVIMSSGVVAATFDVLFVFVKKKMQEEDPRLPTIRNINDVTWYVVIPIVYTVGSGYLLVESIRQLWFLPHRAYMVASWSYYVPHWL